MSVVGIAYDSIRNVPLAGAFITLAMHDRPTRSALSDSAGRFRFDSVVAGDYVATVQHAVFDSIGVSGRSTRVDIRDPRDTIRLSTPSFAHIWRVACGARAPPADRGFVFGTVRSAATRRPSANVTVTVRWVDVALDKTAGIEQHPWRADVRTDSSGDYRACGVPEDAVLQIGAASDAASLAGELTSGVIDIAPNNWRVRRLDLLMGAAARGDGASDALMPGIVAGFVTSIDGQPVAGARVAVGDEMEVRADTGGRFVLGDVPTGTRQLEIRAIGMSPASAVVDVYPRDTSRITVALRSVTTLDPMQVRTTTSYRRLVVDGFQQRRSLGFGYFRDSSDLARHATLASVFEEMPSVIAGPSGGTRGAVITLPDAKGVGRCEPTIWIDGILADADHLDEFGPRDLAAVEVYPRAMATPGQFISRKAHALCGAVVVWTKRAFP